MLEGIDTRVNVDFFSNRYEWEALADTVVYTGKIYEFFDYCYGRLDYRSLRFEHEIVNSPNYQGNAVINYTDAGTPFTRIIEHKHFEMFGQQVYDNPKTVISREYPIEWQEGLEPYYPINDNRNNILASQYREKGSTKHNVIFGGRLAEYKYYDMAPVIESVINWWDKQQ
jgi:UDP-galactopyranose mutase